MKALSIFLQWLFALLGLLLVQLFDDLHAIFANNYLHLVDSDKVLICKVFNIAKQISTYLHGSNLKISKANKFFDKLMDDENKNVQVTVDVNGEEHTLSIKLTGRGITLATRNKKLRV